MAQTPANVHLAADDGPVTGPDAVPAGCRDDDAGTRPLAVQVDDPTSNIEDTTAHGAIAFPAGDPRGLVVFTHGYGHSSHSWLEHLQWAADEVGVVALAMDYRGTLELPEDGEVGGTRGWQVREGAADSNSAALTVLAACPAIDEVTLFGVSMGTNTAGLALAAQPVRADGAPLYDWWFNVEGAANVAETYLEARSLASSGNAFANNAVEDIEREVGGPIEDDPAAYRDLAVVGNVDAIAASGVKGVWHLHGLEDGLVPYDQARELHALLAHAGLPQQFFTALRRSTERAGADMTNATDYAVDNVDPTWDSPFVGHGSESSADNDVMFHSFERLRELVLDRELLDTCSEGLLDAGAWSSVAVPCP